MKYKIYTEEQIPLIVPEGQVMSGTICRLESWVPINKGDKIVLDSNNMKKINLNVCEVEVVENPMHVIKEGKITLSILTVKKIT